MSFFHGSARRGIVLLTAVWAGSLFAGFGGGGADSGATRKYYPTDFRAGCSSQLLSLGALVRAVWKKTPDLGIENFRIGENFPGDPVSRAWTLGQLENPHLVVSRTFQEAVDGVWRIRPVLQNQILSSIRVIPHSGLDTLLFANASDVHGLTLYRVSGEDAEDPIPFAPFRPRPEAKALVTLRHNWTRTDSNGLQLTPLLKGFGSLPNLSLAPVAWDYPQHGGGRRGHSMSELDALLAYEKQAEGYFASFEKPIVDVSMGASAWLSMQKYYELTKNGGVSPVRAMVWIDPLAPDEGALQGHFSRAVSDISALHGPATPWNPFALSWFRNIFSQFRDAGFDSWYKYEWPFGVSAPKILILARAERSSVNHASKVWYQQLAQRFKGVIEYREVGGVGRNGFFSEDLFAAGLATEEASAVFADDHAIVWGILNKFLESVLK